jgi:uncharacterized protein (TIGR01777 family)
MKVVIAGGTGFLGRSLAHSLSAKGWEVVVLSRGGPRPRSGSLRFVTWSPTGGSGSWADEIEDAAAVVNLAGESVAGRRWSDEHKRQILDSRVQATRALVAAILAATRRPRAFISGSAVGYYGPRGDETITEEHSAGTDFLAKVCAAWESEAAGVGDAARVVYIRTGLVLDGDGGALPQMLLPFKLGAGGPLGSGRQYWPWIHRDDWVAMIRWAIDTSQADGPLNATAPNPVTNAEFAKALGRAMHRPAFLPAPAFALRIAVGEMADPVLLSGQRAIPAKAQRLGFLFRHAHIDEALRTIFGPAKS